MNLKESLQNRLSRAEMVALAKKVCAQEDSFKTLIHLILKGKPPVPQYGAWLLQHCSDQAPQLIKPYVSRLLSLIEGDVHDGVRRGVLRSLEPIDLADKDIGKAADLCFRYLADPKEPVAVRVFAMSILGNICKKEADLIEELTLLIHAVIPTGSAALAARGRMVLKKLARY
jgi:hypothetical protein